MTLAVTVPAGTVAEVVLPLHPAGETHEVTAGDHRWTYAVPAVTRGNYGLDSTLKEIADDAAAWRAFFGAFSSHFPGVPLDGTAPEAAFMTVNTMLEYVPGASDELRDDLASALSRV
jgi:alpha-L-rhamnosidase